MLQTVIKYINAGIAVVVLSINPITITLAIWLMVIYSASVHVNWKVLLITTFVCSAIALFLHSITKAVLRDWARKHLL